MVGKDGNLYFAHLVGEDSRNDYTCNIQYLATRTILAKEPITLSVNPCEFFSADQALLFNFLQRINIISKYIYYISSSL